MTNPFAFTPTDPPPAAPAEVKVYTLREKIVAWSLFSVIMAAVMGTMVAVEEGIFEDVFATDPAPTVTIASVEDNPDYQIGYDAGFTLSDGRTAYGAIYGRNQGYAICEIVADQARMSNRTSDVRSLPIWTRGCKAAMTASFKS